MGWIVGFSDTASMSGHGLQSPLPPAAMMTSLLERAIGPAAAVPPDLATCPDCADEILDPGNRRYRYPFTSCARCGPRLSIARGAPWSRALTTMSSFEMCARCQAEYDDPEGRR